MSWSTSVVSRAAIADMMTRVNAMDLDSDVLKVAAFNNSITPNKDDSSANFAYNVSQWATANEQYATGWPQGGVTLAGKAVTTPGSGIVMFDANDPISTTATTLANIYGLLVYDSSLVSPVANQALAGLYLGGASGVTAGTYMVSLHANGILRITV
jgi:hypothetical protein